MPGSLAYNAVTNHLFALDATSQFLTVLSGNRPERVGRVQISRRPAAMLSASGWASLELRLSPDRHSIGVGPPWRGP
jgi:hypothetical protein